MPIITYPFQPDFLRNSKTNKLVVTYRPYIDIKIGIENKWKDNKITCLIDSGADRNLFPASTVKSLGVVIQKGSKTVHKGIGNYILTSYTHTVKISIENKTFETEIDFSEDAYIPLLGRQGFFNYFKKISFIMSEKIVELKY